MQPAHPLPSDRSFGLTFAFVFAAIGAWMIWKPVAFAPWSFGLSAGFLLAAVALPRVLRPLNQLWMRFGALLHRIVSPVVLGAIFFVVITPVALVMRARGRDALHRRLDSNLVSYWIARDPPGPDARASFPRQF